MSKNSTPYLVPVILLSILFSFTPLIGYTNQLQSVNGWWEDLFGGSTAKDESFETISIYAEISGVDGESTDSEHSKWIDVLYLNFSLHKPGSAVGATRRRGDIILEDIIITKLVDKSTPKLIEATAKGTVYSTINFEFTKSIGSTKVVFYKYELKNVMITAFQSIGMVGDTIPTETLSLNYEEVKVIYTEYDSEGKSKGNVEMTWKVEEGIS